MLNEEGLRQQLDSTYGRLLRLIRTYVETLGRRDKR